MFKPIEGGTVENINGMECWVPPVGYGVHRVTGELIFIGVHSRSDKKSDQKWERLLLPKDYDKRYVKELQRQKEDPDYFDPELEAIREEHWRYRMCGHWFMNNGNPTYITGTHWLYLNWCRTNAGYLNFRDTDRKIFYALRYCDEDPNSGGLVYISRRQGGKTYMAIAWQIDRISLAQDKLGGIQSKTDPDAQMIFNKLVNYFYDFPHFFKPIYDTSQGLRPKKELRFFKTTVRGKNAESMIEGEELRSVVNFGSSESYYYDGRDNMYAYILDEFGKPQKSNVWDTWNIVRPTMNKEGKWFGKSFVTSTIEDMEVTGEGPLQIWKNSDQSKRDENGYTASGLYRLFFGAHESTFFDEYGIADVEKGITFYTNMRKSYANDTRTLSSIIRKNPFTIEEAFRFDGDKCLYNEFILNERRDVLSWKQNLTTKGDFIWIGGERDKGVVFEPRQNGKWEVVYLFDDEKKANKVIKRGELFYPGNRGFVIGVDPFDHVKAQDGRMSNGAIVVKKKYSPIESEYNGAFIAKYCYRPETPQMFYEEVIKAAFYYGCDVLFENNKIGLQHYMQDRGYFNFLMWLPDRLQPGIAASPKTTQYIAEITDTYINENINEVYFMDLIDDWLNFSVENTTKFDLAMAAGYAEIADRVKVVKNKKEDDFIPVDKVFRKFKVNR